MDDLAQSNVERVVLLSGPIASGKTSLGRLLAGRFGLCIVSTRELLAQGIQDRRFLQAAGALQDDSTAGRWVRDGLVQFQSRCPDQVSFVVDSVRALDQIRWVRETYGPSVQHIHLTASAEVLATRYESKSEGYQYDEVRDDPVEQTVWLLGESANVVIDTSYLCPESVLLQVVKHLGLPA